MSGLSIDSLRARKRRKKGWLSNPFNKLTSLLCTSLLVESFSIVFSLAKVVSAKTNSVSLSLPRSEILSEIRAGVLLRSEIHTPIGTSHYY